MPFLFQYLIKFSISLAVLYTFYYVVLRPLTFYQWNRFYLVCYSLLSFVIPFINITEWLAVKDIDNSYLINSIPAVDKLMSHSFNTSSERNILSAVLSWNFAGLLFLAGAFIMLTRILYQCLSLRALKRKAVLLKTGDFEFYDVNGPITPFSFANAIFINSRLHSEEEFRKILEHEFVHVKQKHTIDIVVAELICVVNWFNPFAWLIRKSIRQNLEFIADKNVLDGGIDLRRYQYLLLKVMGLPQYSITNNFSFSSLKKRITMMNKMKTAKVHLVKFLFVLPLLTVMLLAFRGKIKFKKDALMLTYAGIIINSRDNHPLKNIVIRELNTNAEIKTDDKGFFKLRVPVIDDNTNLRINILKDNDLKKEVTIRWVKYAPQASESFIGLVSIDNESSGSIKCDKCFVYQDQVVDKNGLFVKDLSYEIVYEKVHSYLEVKNDWQIISRSSKPIIKIKNNLYIFTGVIPSRPGSKEDYPSSFVLMNIKENPVIYLNGALSGIESVNATVERVAIKQIDRLDKETSLKKYGNSAEVIDVTTYSGVGTDTIPGAPVPPAPAKPDIKHFPVEPQPPASPALAVQPEPVADPVAALPPLLPSPVPSLKAKPVKAPAAPVFPVTVVKKITVIKNISYNKQGKTITQKQAVTFKAPVTINVPVKRVNTTDTIIPKQSVKVINQPGSNEPLYIVDGIMLPKGKDIQHIDPNLIKEINILKDANAIALYGDKAKNGVVQVKTKEKYVADDSVSITASKIVLSNIKDIKSLIIVDGLETSKEKLSAIDPNFIKSISILKDKSATTLYGEKGKDGVIIVTTKKTL
jgi:TonB-dependent SusC/RagA subfamily outer membrane receptor